MRFTLEMSARGCAAEAETTVEVAQAAERAGFSHIAYTEHPAPDAQWRQSAVGHPTFDPYAALAFVAAVTTRIRLMTYVAVLPYRNPLLSAKSIATVDRLSGGRLTVTVGAGYLESEHAAVGADFSERAFRYDEALDVLVRIFDGPFTFEGRNFRASQVVIDPPPVQRPHPPIWIGGSSTASLRRVVSAGSGWAPGLEVGAISNSAPGATTLASLDAVGQATQRLRHQLVEAGRDPSEISVQLDFLIQASMRVDEQLRLVGDAAEAGVTDLVMRPRGRTADELVDCVESFGRDVIAVVSANATTGRAYS